MVDERYRHIGNPAIRVMEECAELTQAIAKGLRFGWDNRPPQGGATNLDNAKHELHDIQMAFNDLMEVISGQTTTRG